MARRAYTVDEANELLPHVRTVLAELRRVRDRGLRTMDKLAVLDALWGLRVTESANPDHDEYERLRTTLEEAGRRIEARVKEGLTARDIRLPMGGLDHGLVDFPTTLDGRWVYLCWQIDEPELVAWHELDGGFAGRRPLTPEERRRMGRADDPALEDDAPLDF